MKNISTTTSNKVDQTARSNIQRFRKQTQSLIALGQLIVFNNNTVSLTPICEMTNEEELRGLYTNKALTAGNKQAIEQRIKQITRLRVEHISITNPCAFEKWAKTLSARNKTRLVDSEKQVVYEHLKAFLKQKYNDAPHKIVCKRYNPMIVQMILFNDEYNLARHIKADKAAQDTACILFFHSIASE
jgi:F0F1-type ATP synthase membrane subunit a